MIKSIKNQFFFQQCGRLYDIFCALIRVGGPSLESKNLDIQT